jgi:hypothetical protein
MWWKAVALSALCLAVTACGETRFLETMGMGKHPPDETKVRRNADLALPPDLSLPAPSEVAEAPATAAQATSPQQLSNPPAGDLAASMDPTQDLNVGAQPSYDTAAAPGAPTATAVSPAVRPAAAGNPRENALVKYGISKTHPNGKPKTEGELNKELLDAIRAEKRRQDPKYGTIFNIGGLFGGN